MTVALLHYDRWSARERATVTSNVSQAHTFSDQGHEGADETPSEYDLTLQTGSEPHGYSASSERSFETAARNKNSLPVGYRPSIHGLSGQHERGDILSRSLEEDVSAVPGEQCRQQSMRVA